MNRYPKLHKIMKQIHDIILKKTLYFMYEDFSKEKYHKEPKICTNQDFVLMYTKLKELIGIGIKENIIEFHVSFIDEAIDEVANKLKAVDALDIQWEMGEMLQKVFHGGKFPRKFNLNWQKLLMSKLKEQGKLLNFKDLLPFLEYE